MKPSKAIADCRRRIAALDARTAAARARYTADVARVETNIAESRRLIRRALKVEPWGGA